ncbi:hypothetical protein JW916_00040, partial [Candidatus Sumerlaeota bacterium]|nr:hypothetical protein [Candidatus Sumerlaeota bacterium]
NGGIGWDATGAGGGALGANYGTWYLSDDGANAKFLIPGGGMDGKVYRVRAGLISDQATRAATCSWRLLALSYQTVAWQGVQVLTSGADETDAPISTDSSFETQIHFTPPYELSEWADGGALDATDWVAVGDVNAPADGRDYTLTFDGLDVGDSGHMWMDYCVVESYARPADKTTPDLEWGAGATAFNDAANGFNFPTTSAFPTLALLPTPDAGTRTADYVTLAMGALPGGSDTGLARWSQASQAPASVTQKYAEVAGDLLRYTIHSYSPSPDTAPVVRYQTTPFNAAGSAADQTIWFDAFGPFDTRLHLTNSGTVDAPGSPKTTVAGGSDVDVYRYVMRTTTGRWLHFYWDAYGLPVSTAQAANGWASQTGAITVTSIVLNGALPNP